MTDSAVSSPALTLQDLQKADPVLLAQALASQMAIQPNDWHRLNRDRAVRAREQAAAALVYLLKDQPDAGLEHLQQAVGWLDKTLTAPPCPTHGHRKKAAPSS